MKEGATKKDLLTILDLTHEDALSIFRLAAKLKAEAKRGVYREILSGKTLGMIFQKPSTRTHVSFAVGIYELGGHAVYLNTQDMQLKRGESITDTAKTLSRYLDGLMIRTYSHKDVEEMAQASTIPIINGLTDLHHPCQVLGDIFTLMEKKGLLFEGASFPRIKAAYVGDGNNVAHSWIHGAALLGMKLSLACPAKYAPEKSVLEEADNLFARPGAEITLTEDAASAVENADLIYTDVWASMGKDVEREERLQILRPYQVNGELLAKAKPDCLVMHCLPAHRGEEITDEVMDGPHSVVWDEAENRLHVQKAIMIALMGDRKNPSARKQKKKSGRRK